MPKDYVKNNQEGRFHLWAPSSPADFSFNHLARSMVADRTGDKQRVIGPVVAGLAGMTFLAATLGIGLGWFYTQPPRRTPPPGTLMKKMGIPYRPVSIQTRDGCLLAGWFTPSRNNGTILVTHGWGTCRLEAYHALFASHGYGVISWDFRSHGDSHGNFIHPAITKPGMLRQLQISRSTRNPEYVSVFGAVPWAV